MMKRPITRNISIKEHGYSTFIDDKAGIDHGERSTADLELGVMHQKVMVESNKVACLQEILEEVYHSPYASRGIRDIIGRFYKPVEEIEESKVDQHLKISAIFYGEV